MTSIKIGRNLVFRIDDDRIRGWIGSQSSGDRIVEQGGPEGLPLEMPVDCETSYQDDGKNRVARQFPGKLWRDFTDWDA